MLYSSTNSDSTMYATLVHQMMLEDVRFDQNERRSNIREVLVRPALVRPKDSTETLLCISRNISGSGVCIIAIKPIPEKTIARIFIHRLTGTPAEFLAECRWTKPFGTGWYLSGWHFLDAGNQQPKIREINMDDL